MAHWQSTYLKYLIYSLVPRGKGGKNRIRAFPYLLLLEMLKVILNVTLISATTQQKYYPLLDFYRLISQMYCVIYFHDNSFFLITPGIPLQVILQKALRQDFCVSSVSYERLNQLFDYITPT